LLQACQTQNRLQAKSENQVHTVTQHMTSHSAVALHL
jgi:hypothetical protein